MGEKVSFWPGEGAHASCLEYPTKNKVHFNVIYKISQQNGLPIVRLNLNPSYLIE